MPVILVFLTLFVGIPLVELYFLIKVGSFIGAMPTILLTLFTAVLGGTLVRIQGLSTAMRVRESMERGEVPAIEMIEGVVLLASGVLLLLPGFITDVIGFVCLIPPVRRLMILALLKRKGVMRPPPGGAGHEHSPSSSGQPRIIDGEFTRDDDSRP
ncbi:MAG: exlusion protein FxsA [Sedimenticola sp.]|jgi:UPF0716 protein FxsA|nr:MAG: exlusion protein FxsA [Sedimenticola sp.]